MNLKFSNKNKKLSSYGIKNPLEGAYEKMKMKAQKALRLDDGEHEGEILDILYRDDPHEYTDIVVKVQEGKLTAGYPSNLIEGGLLFELLSRFGAVVKIGEEFEPEQFITKGKKVKFSIVNKTKEGKKYANIVRETLRPAE